MPIKEDMAWLAGIIDGEGCILLRLPPEGGYHLCRVIIVNTDNGILEEVKRIYDEWQVFYTQQRKPISTNGHKPCYTVEVNRRMECQFLLGQILPYLKSNSRKTKANELLEFVETHRRKDGQKSNCIKRRI